MNVSERTRPWVFYGLAVAMVTAIALRPDASTSMAMLTPAAAALLMLLVVTREGWRRAGWTSLGLHRAGFRSWLPAIAVPVAVVGIAHALLWATGLAAGGANEATRGVGIEMLPVLLLGNIVGASVTVSLAEEIGWRGYLLPRLTHLGHRRALLLSGLMHGAWHLPVIFLTSLYHPHGSRWVVVPLFLVTVTAAGVFMGSLRLRSGSVWPAVIAHSAHNAAFAWFAAYTIGDPVAHEYLAGESGLLTASGYVLVAVLLLRRSHVATSRRTRGGARCIETSVDIDAPADAVWDVLVDFARYPEWNPFVVSVSGRPVAGSRLQVRLRPPGGRVMRFRPRVLVAEPARELRWLGRLLVPGVFDGEHSFVLTRTGPDRCRLVQAETFSGVLVRLFAGGLSATAVGFDEMNRALKARVEAPTNAVVRTES